jgi:phage protein D/phage baseplate assembly protein gpV
MPDSKLQKTRISQFFIQVNGSDLPGEAMDQLDSATVEDDLAQPAMFTLRFNDPRLELTDGATFALGAEVKLGAADSEGRRKPIIVGEITAVEPFLEQQHMTLTVRGYDRAHRLNRGTKTRTFLKQSDSDIARKVASEAGLQAEVETTSARHEYVVQDNQTDLEFLRERAQRNGFQVVVEERKLRFRPAEKSPPAAPDLDFGQNLLSFRARITAARQPSEVHVRGWDPSTKKAIVGKATSAAQASSIGDGKKGGEAAKAAFNGAATLVVTDQLVMTAAEATSYAQAILDDENSDYLTAEGRCLGEPGLRAGHMVKVTNAGKRMSGSYFVTATRHEYTLTEGYVTTFFASGQHPTSLLAALRDRPSGRSASGVVTAIVTNANDPQKLGRVKLAFKWLDDQHETDWVRVVIMGGGSSRGLMILPEVDDEVLVAFEHGDLNQPYVIGGLWNSKDKPPSEAVNGGKVQTRTLTTRSGHAITLRDDDSAGQIELKTKKHTAILDDSGSGKVQIKTGKHTVTLDDTGSGTITVKSARHSLTLDDTGVGKVAIESGGDIELKGPGGKLSITASGIEINSQTMLKMQANAMLDVKSTGILTIQGSLVKIN